MFLKNHISYRFLTDEKFPFEILDAMHPSEMKTLLKEEYTKEGLTIEIPVKDESHIQRKVTHPSHYLNTEGDLEAMLSVVRSTYDLICNREQKTYYMSETVSELLYLLKAKRGSDNSFDWKVFKDIPECKKTFILPNTGDVQNVLRVKVEDDFIRFCYLTYTPSKEKKYTGESHWAIFYINRKTGEACEHSMSEDVLRVDEMVYRIMCFTFLVDNEEIYIQPKHRYGTKKTGKIINEFSIPLTIINSRWNQTIIRTDGFGVRGHFAIRMTGNGRTIPKVVFIHPYKKNGYVRKSGKLLEGIKYNKLS